MEWEQWQRHIDYKVYMMDCYGSWERYILGFVKQDGCSNWHFPDFEQCMFHCRTREDLKILSDLMQYCWDHCRQHLPNFQGDTY